MTSQPNQTQLFAGVSKFFNEVFCALFVSSDKKEFQRLKNFITS
jgi:hypothetical protein